MEYPIASGPTLPTSMVVQRRILPTILKEGVMPVESPTVPNAETVSNMIPINDAFSVRDKTKTSTIINNRARVQMASALSLVLEDICLLNNINSSSIDMTEIMDEI